MYEVVFRQGSLKESFVSLLLSEFQFLDNWTNTYGFDTPVKLFLQAFQEKVVGFFVSETLDHEGLPSRISHLGYEAKLPKSMDDAIFAITSYIVWLIRRLKGCSILIYRGLLDFWAPYFTHGLGVGCIGTG